MAGKPANIGGAIDQLRDRASAKRRSAAKKLRKAGRIEAGPPLIAALENEMRDLRTWETQYQMAMALGECGATDALPLLYGIAAMDLKATMVHIGVGDAVTRLESVAGTPFRSLRDWLTSEENRLAVEAEARVANRPGAVSRAVATGLAAWNRFVNPGPPSRRPVRPRFPEGHDSPLVDGGLRAVAMARLVPDADLIDRAIRYASLPANTGPRFWVAAACAGWDGDNVIAFLNACLENSLPDDTRRAAKAALEKKYLKWEPL